MSSQSKSQFLQTAINAAIKAGEIHLKYYGKQKQIDYKLNEFDVVTNADKEAEAIIIETIQQTYPDHDILAEESNNRSRKSDFQWIIDPLDGTTNYAHNFPQFCVSIALRHNDDIFIGVVYDALKKELFHAQTDKGAYLNDKSITTSEIKEVKGALLATGFPYDRTSHKLPNLNYFEEFSYRSMAIRRPGSAALDMCYVACGRLDGFWELKLAPWDTAAGTVIVREAGGIVTNFHKNDFDIFTPDILASNRYIYGEMSEILQYTDNKNQK